MNKTVNVPSYFQPTYKEVTVKVPTGNTKRFLGLIKRFTLSVTDHYRGASDETVL